MKLLVLLLVLPLAAFSWVDEYGIDSSIPVEASPAADATINLSVVNTFQVTGTPLLLGNDMQVTSFGAVNADADQVVGVSSSGSTSWTFDIDFTGYGSNFGTCHTAPVPYDWYVNCWNMSDMYLYDTGSDSWSTAFANPAGTDGRGMAYNDDTNYIWQTASSNGIWRIADPGGSGDFYGTPEIPSQMSGLAIFPYGSDLWVVATIYGAPEFYFYKFTGSALEYQGMADLTMTSFDYSFGLAYCASNDTFFWIYQVYGGTNWVAEIGYTITALEQSTWGAIKSQF